MVTVADGQSGYDTDSAMVMPSTSASISDDTTSTSESSDNPRLQVLLQYIHYSVCHSFDALTLIICEYTSSVSVQYCITCSAYTCITLYGTL